jgi:sodium transport system ATP-binding protein
VIEVDRLSKSFGAVRAVQEVSFSAPDGRITGLLGPNGAGKSTTLRLLYTVLRPDGGSARVDGIDIVHDAVAARRRIGVLPHGAGLYPNLTARENVRYHGELCGLGGAALEARLDELVALLDLRDIEHRRAKGFSQGQRTRVALARALVHDPQNLLLDEPSNGLDVLGTRALRALIRRLREAGRCVLFSSHVMQEVSALCDAIVVIAHGRVVARGTPDDLRKHTGHDNLEDAFVALASVERGAHE